MIKKMLEVIQNSTGILLGAHTSPDGDAIGALVGMAILCEFLQKPYVILLEAMPERFKDLLEGKNTACVPQVDYNTFIALDCGDEKRLGTFSAYYKEAEYTLCIDHHATNQAFAKYNQIEPEASSTCELVFKFIEEAKCPITPSLAAALFTGVLTDTGGFMHSSTHASTHEVVAKLMQVPFDFTGICYRQLYEKTEAACHLEARALSHLEKLDQGQIFISFLSPQDLEACAASKDDVGGVITYLKQIKGCEMAALLYANGTDTYKLSVRSNAPYDAIQIASCFGGGGHIRAAGATLEGTLEELVLQVKEKLMKVIERE